MSTALALAAPLPRSGHSGFGSGVTPATGETRGQPAPALSGQDPLLHRVVAERYRIDQRLAQGQGCNVYRAFHIQLGRPRALKVQRGPQTGAGRRRLHKEAYLGARVEHANVIRVYDYALMPDGRPYLVLELVEGPLLRQVLRRGPIAPLRACRLGVQAAQGLAALHEAGVVHRDVRPDNIALCGDNGDERVKLLDLGQSCNIGATLTTVDMAETTPGIPREALRYAAPEQAQGAAPDPRADQYALGLVLHEALTGTLPRDGAPIGLRRGALAAQLAAQGLSDPRSSGDSALLAELDAVVVRALSRDPAQRFPSLRHLEHALSRASIQML